MSWPIDGVIVGGIVLVIGICIVTLDYLKSKRKTEEPEEINNMDDIGMGIHK